MRVPSLLCAGLLLLAGGVSAQAPPHIDATTLALRWILGRFQMPLTCLREDGSRIQVEEAVVIRTTQDPRLAKATFFGVDVADATRCYNVVERNLPDRRGVLYLTYRWHVRPDLGTSDFRRALASGPLRYTIERGTLRQRPIGTAEGPVSVVEFEGAGAELVVSDVARGSDGDKLLGTPRTSAAGKGRRSRVPRRFVIEIQGHKDFSFRGYFLEDERRWK